MTAPTELPEKATRGEVLGPAMEITDQAKADAYFEMVVDHYQKQDPSVSREDMEKNLRQHLGYYSGYYPVEVQERVERLFKCRHPVFGSVNTPTPSLQRTLEAGILTVQRVKEGASTEEAMSDAARFLQEGS